ncbi:MAG: sugar transferase [Patescibacteria group bacterium]
MKKADFIINIALVPIDFLLVVLAAVSAYYLRFSTLIADAWPVLYTMPINLYMAIVWRVATASVIIFAASGFYTMRNKKISKEFTKIIAGVSTLVIFLVMAIFLQRELFSSRFIIILGWFLAILYLFIARWLIFLVRNYFFQKGIGLSGIIVLGDSQSRGALVSVYRQFPNLGFRILGEFDNLATLSGSAQVRDWLNKKQLDTVVQTDSSIGKDDALDLLTWCQENHLNFNYVANLFQAQSTHLELNSVAGLPLVEIKSTPLEGWRRVYKRLFDLVVSILLIIILSPVLLLLAILVALTSPGPMIVGLERVGAKNKIFKMYKFRSMIKNAHLLKPDILRYNERPDGPLFKMKNDPRVTKFGRFLRRTSLDELPQLFNVLLGQMSLVGPRPHEPQEVSQYRRGYKKLLAIKPGMTGMAQVSGRSNLLFSEEAKLDIFYIENWSILLDLIILLKTPKASFKQAGD